MTLHYNLQTKKTQFISNIKKAILMLYMQLKHSSCSLTFMSF
jgi:hypothetical protein